MRDYFVLFVFFYKKNKHPTKAGCLSNRNKQKNYFSNSFTSSLANPATATR